MASTNAENYDKTFYDEQSEDSFISAKLMVPHIIEKLNPDSVIEFGCGVGNWGKVIIEESNVKSYLGVDGEYVLEEYLKIPSNLFKAADLNEYNHFGRFDMALCLETAEHIETKNSKNLVKSLTSASDIIVFGAAIPGQGGTNHINEQWLSFWEDLFSEFGYGLRDELRPIFWDDPRIAYWYIQNTVIFEKDFIRKNDTISDLVHPRTFEAMRNERDKRNQELVWLKQEAKRLVSEIRISKVMKFKGKRLTSSIKFLRRGRI